MKLRLCREQSKKRGLSIEEKKQVVLQIFHETKDVFVLKARCAAAASSHHKASWLFLDSRSARLTTACHHHRTWRSLRRRGASSCNQ